MAIPLRTILVVLLVAVSAVGQTYRNVDGVTNSTVQVVLAADATYRAKRFNVVFQDIGYTSGDHSDSVMTGVGYSMIGSSVYGTYGLASSSYSNLYSSLLSVFGPWSLAITALELYGSSSNTQNRYYTFYAPSDGNYKIACYLKGDWDYPRNRVVLYANNGQQLINFDEQLSYSGVRTFNLSLPKGNHFISVGLGGGSSVVLHTAGSLDSVQLDDSQERTWTLPMIVAANLTSLPSLLPIEGASAQFSVMFMGFPTVNNSNILEGQPIQFSNLRTTNDAGLGNMGGCTLTRYSTIGCRITRPTISSVICTYFDGTVANYQITRGTNEIIYLDPPE